MNKFRASYNFLWLILFLLSVDLFLILIRHPYMTDSLSASLVTQTGKRRIKQANSKEMITVVGRSLILED